MMSAGLKKREKRGVVLRGKFEEWVIGLNTHDEIKVELSILLQKV